MRFKSQFGRRAARMAGAAMLLAGAAALGVSTAGTAHAQEPEVDPTPPAGVSVDLTVSLDGSCPGQDRATVTRDGTVTYCYLVTNGTDQDIEAPILTDDAGGGDAEPVQITAFGNGDGGIIRAGGVGEASRSIVADEVGQMISVVSGTVAGEVVADQAVVTVQAPIVFVAGMVSKSADKTTVAPGEPVMFTYELANDAGVPLTEARVTDSACAPVEFDGGDLNADDVLDTDETWTFRCSAALDASVETASSGGGLDPDGNLVLSTTRLAVRVVGDPVEGSDAGPVTPGPETSSETMPTIPEVQAPSDGAGAPGQLAAGDGATAAPESESAPATLPRTGSDDGGTVGLALSLVLLGAGLVTVASTRLRGHLF